ncbi:MAG: NADH-quinone oxidoreductase subunit M [Planctomycetes bacterium]|nr:NADH-quinone oxidoreductase subunit M [Planctomycetota bacterium]
MTLETATLDAAILNAVIPNTMIPATAVLGSADLLKEYLLPLLLTIPAVGALLVGLMPGRNTKPLWTIALLASVVEAVLCVLAFCQFDSGNPNSQWTYLKPWFTLPLAAGAGIPVKFHLGVDGLSILMVALSGLLGPVILLSARGHIHEREREFLVWAQIMQAGMLGVFLALDLVLFYVFWEVSLIPLYFLIGIWGGPRRIYATVKFFLYTLGGSLLMLVALLYLAYTQRTVDVQTLSTREMALQPQLLAFGAFALAFAIKVPMFPFHTWLPDAHVEAPTSGSIVLAGVLLKMGTYGFLRLGVGMFPEAAVTCAPWLAGLAAAGVVYGSFLAFAQNDIKKLVACSSVAHMGTVMVGIFALNGAGIRGGLLQMVNHGLSTGLLFLLVGVVYERRHVREISEFGGIARTVPMFTMVLLVATFSSIGLPGLNGFPGELLCLKGAFDFHTAIGAVAALGTVLGAVYMLSMARRVLYGPVTRKENHGITDLVAREWVAIALLMVPIVWIGVQPARFLEPTEKSVDLLVTRLERAKKSVAAAQTHDGTRVAALEVPR